MELDLLGNQLDLLDAVLATGTPTLTVLIHGRPATFGGSPNAKWAGGGNQLLGEGKGGHAVLSIWRPGQEGGEAVADIVLGVVQPGGRLAQPWPRSVGYVHSRAAPCTVPFPLYQPTPLSNRAAPCTVLVDGLHLVLFTWLHPPPAGVKAAHFVIQYDRSPLRCLVLSRSPIAAFDVTTLKGGTFTKVITIGGTSTLKQEYQTNRGRWPMDNLGHRCFVSGTVKVIQTTRL
jgi:hypothetical protein